MLSYGARIAMLPSSWRFSLKGALHHPGDAGAVEHLVLFIKRYKCIVICIIVESRICVNNDAALPGQSLSCPKKNHLDADRRAASAVLRGAGTRQTLRTRQHGMPQR